MKKSDFGNIPDMDTEVTQMGCNVPRFLFYGIILVFVKSILFAFILLSALCKTAIGLVSFNYRKFPKFWDARKFCCNLSIKRSNKEVFRQKKMCTKGG